MKKIAILALALASTTSLYAKLNIIVSVIPQQTFVEKIGGDKVNVTRMVKPGSDPHSYEPKPSRMIALSKGEYTWSFDKVKGEYADPKMKFLMIKADKKSEDIIKTYESEAKKAFNANITTAKNHDYIDINNKTYSLQFDQSKNRTIFRLRVEKDEEYIFFTEHMPFEFEDKEHFLKDVARNDIEPLASYPESGGHHHHHHHDFDPHTWVSPSNVKIMAKNILIALSKKDPQNTEYYQKNFNMFINEINTTDAKIKKIFSSIPRG